MSPKAFYKFLLYFIAETEDGKSMASADGDDEATPLLA